MSAQGRRSIGGMLVLLLGLGACTPTASTTAGDASVAVVDAGSEPLLRCETTKTALDATLSELVVTVKVMGAGGVGATATGTVDVAVEHTPVEGSAPATVACAIGTAKLERTSYAPDQTFTVRVKVPAECPRTPPEGFVVALKVDVRPDGSGSTVGCSFFASAPGALGGGDMNLHDQIAAARSRRGTAATKATSVVVDKLATSLAKAMRGIDPAKAPEKRACPAPVTGKALVLPYEVVWRAALSAAGTNVDALPSWQTAPAVPDGGLPPPLSTSTPIGVVGGSRLGQLLNRRDDAATADELTKSAESAPPLVVVATTLGMEPPRATFDATKTGRVQPGRYRGALFVVDRDKGAILCTTTVTAQSAPQRFEGSTPTEVTQAIDADFKRQIEYARADALKGIAPTLVIAP